MSLDLRSLAPRSLKAFAKKAGWRTFRWLPRLFDGDGARFMELARQSHVYGEYGCGRSTLWMVQNSRAVIYSVDTSEEWVESVRADAGESDRLRLHWVDLGPLGEWGYPTGDGHRERYSDYTDWIWQQGEEPDLVLVDGRFRVACFLTSLLHARPGTVVVFDDYADRPSYHVVEQLLPVRERAGRQAVFEVPELTEAQRELAVRLLEQHRRIRD